MCFCEFRNFCQFWKLVQTSFAEVSSFNVVNFHQYCSAPLDLFYDKVQDRGQKIRSFEDKIQCQSDKVVMKFIL